MTPDFARELRAAGIADLLPESSLVVQQGVSGAGLYARHPLAELPEPTRFHFRMPRAALTLPGGRRLRVVGIHPYPPVRKRVDEWQGAREPSRDRQWHALDPRRGLQRDPRPRRAARGARPRLPRRGRGDGPRPGADLAGGSYRSPPVTIDHVLADQRIGVADYAVIDLPGSDHRSVFAQLVLP